MPQDVFIDTRLDKEVSKPNQGPECPFNVNMKKQGVSVCSLSPRIRVAQGLCLCIQIPHPRPAE